MEPSAVEEGRCNWMFVQTKGDYWQKTVSFRVYWDGDSNQLGKWQYHRRIHKLSFKPALLLQFTATSIQFFRFYHSNFDTSECEFQFILSDNWCFFLIVCICEISPEEFFTSLFVLTVTPLWPLVFPILFLPPCRRLPVYLWPSRLTGADLFDVKRKYLFC